MSFNITLGYTYVRNSQTLYYPYYYNSHTYGSWQKRMLTNGGNRFGTQGTLGHKIGVNRI